MEVFSYHQGQGWGTHTEGGLRDLTLAWVTLFASLLPYLPILCAEVAGTLGLVHLLLPFGHMSPLFR